MKIPAVHIEPRPSIRPNFNIYSKDLISQAPFFLFVLVNNLLAVALILAGGWLLCIPTFLVSAASGYFAGLYFFAAYKLYGLYSVLLYLPLPLEIASIVIAGNLAISLCKRQYNRLLGTSYPIERFIVKLEMRKLLLVVFLLAVGSLLEYLLLLIIK